MKASQTDKLNAGNKRKEARSKYELSKPSERQTGPGQLPEQTSRRIKKKGTFPRYPKHINKPGCVIHRAEMMYEFEMCEPGGTVTLIWEAKRRTVE